MTVSMYNSFVKIASIEAGLTGLVSNAGQLGYARDTDTWYYFDGTNWVTFGGGNAFETINVDNGTDPVADSPTDTLNLVSGSGITITGDSSTDTITISANGGGISSRVRAYDTAGGITVNNSTFTKMTGLDATTEDTDSFSDFGTDDSILTIPSGLGGLYLVGAHVDWDTNTTGNRRIAVVNTTTGASVCDNVIPATFAGDISTSGYAYFSAGDTVSVYSEQNSGAGRTARVKAFWLLKVA